MTSVKQVVFAEDAPVRESSSAALSRPAEPDLLQLEQPLYQRVEPTLLPTLSEIKRLRVKMDADSKRVEKMIRIAKNSSHEKLFLSTVEASLREANENFNRQSTSEFGTNQPRLAMNDQVEPIVDKMEGGDRQVEAKESVRVNCLYEKDLEYYSGPGSGKVISNFYQSLGKDNEAENTEEDQENLENLNNYMEEWKEMRRLEKEAEMKVLEKLEGVKVITMESKPTDDSNNATQPESKIDDTDVEKKSITEGTKPEKKISKAEQEEFTSTLKNRINGVNRALAMLTRERHVVSKYIEDVEDFD